LPTERRDDFFRDFFTSNVLACLVEGNVTRATVITATLLKEYGIDVPANVLEADIEEEKNDGTGGV